MNSNLRGDENRNAMSLAASDRGEPAYAEFAATTRGHAVAVCPKYRALRKFAGSVTLSTEDNPEFLDAGIFGIRVDGWGWGRL
jgi:hypothetical protein